MQISLLSPNNLFSLRFWSGMALRTPKNNMFTPKCVLVIFLYFQFLSRMELILSKITQIWVILLRKKMVFCTRLFYLYLLGFVHYILQKYNIFCKISWNWDKQLLSGAEWEPNQIFGLTEIWVILPKSEKCPYWNLGKIPSLWVVPTVNCPRTI